MFSLSAPVPFGPVPFGPAPFGPVPFEPTGTGTTLGQEGANDGSSCQWCVRV
jgi:hypothetical protein